MASSIAGDLLGTGPGRGIGAIFVLTGLLLALVSGLAWSNSHICRVEEELPDAVIQVEEPGVETPAVEYIGEA